MVTLAPEQFPNRDVRVDDDFMDANKAQLTICGAALYNACVAVPGVLDSDVREALDALVEKYRTSLIYEPTLQNSIAAAVYRGFEKGVEEFREKIRSSGGNTETFIDQFMFRIVVFLQRLALMHNNGRAKGRYYIQFLSGLTRPMSTPEAMAEGQ